jgi:hypothetical protein
MVRSNAIDLEQLIDGVRYVQLENSPESAFTDIDKLIAVDGNIFMLDKRLEAVFCFDTTGHFRYRIQKVGRGPGEYLELEAMWIKPGIRELWLHSFWPPKIMVYDFDGNLIRETKTGWPARDMTGLANGLIVGYNTTPSGFGTDSLREGLFLTNEKGRTGSQALVLGDSSVYWSLVHQRNLEEFENGALLLSQSDTLFKINPEGEVTPDFILDWGKAGFPAELRGIPYGSLRSNEVLHGDYVNGKDQLIAFGPIRIFRIFLNARLQLAMADLRSGWGEYSSQMTCRMAKVPLIYPLGKSDRGELIGMYDMSVLLAMKESREFRTKDSGSDGVYQEMDSLVDFALKQDRPVLWFAGIKSQWLTKIQ